MDMMHKRTQKKIEKLTQKTNALMDAKKKYIDTLKDVNPANWILPQPDEMLSLVDGFFARTKIRIKRWWFLKYIPFFKRYAYNRPLYYAVLFFPNNAIGIKCIEQEWNGTLKLNTRSMQINPDKVKQFGSDSVLFYNYDNAEPLDVSKSALAVLTHNPILYDENLKNHQISELLKPTENNKMQLIIICILIAVGGLLLFLIAKTMGWIKG